MHKMYMCTREYIYCTCICIRLNVDYLSVLSQYPDEGSLALRVNDGVEAGGELGQNDLDHVIKLTQNVCRDRIESVFVHVRYTSGTRKVYVRCTTRLSW